MTSTTTYVGSPAEPHLAAKVDQIIAGRQRPDAEEYARIFGADLDPCVSCGGPGAVYGYWTCSPCLGR